MLLNLLRKGPLYPKLFLSEYDWRELLAQNLFKLYFMSWRHDILFWWTDCFLYNKVDHNLENFDWDAAGHTFF